MIKRFLKWIQIKIALHSSHHEPPLVKERDLWWISMGDNIGSEINGKGELFTRPVIILRKMTQSFYLVAPTTSKARFGSWYVKIELNSKVSFVCLHQIKTIDYRRLHGKIGQINNYEFESILERFKMLYIK